VVFSGSPPHSAANAVRGSTCDARRAGIHVARTATRPTNAAALANVDPSVGRPPLLEDPRNIHQRRSRTHREGNQVRASPRSRDQVSLFALRSGSIPRWYVEPRSRRSRGPGRATWLSMKHTVSIVGDRTFARTTADWAQCVLLSVTPRCWRLLPLLELRAKSGFCNHSGYRMPGLL